MDSSNIHVVSISRCFDTASQLVNRVKQELAAFKGKTIILLFPEAVIGHTNYNGAIIPHTIGRNEGKALANELHKLASAHGSAYMAYSTLEHFPEKASAKKKRRPDNSLKESLGPKDYSRAINAGYLIMPKKEHKLGYKVYPKLTTYKKGQLLTQFDEKELLIHHYDSKDMARSTKRRARSIKAFPEVNIGGKRVQLRVCSDVSSQKRQNDNRPDTDYYLTQDHHPARKSKGIHLILSPSQSSQFLAEDIAHIANCLAPKGILVTSDASPSKYRAVVLTRHRPGVTGKTVNENRPRKRGPFRIHHKA